MSVKQLNLLKIKGDVLVFFSENVIYNEILLDIYQTVSGSNTRI